MLIVEHEIESGKNCRMSEDILMMKIAQGDEDSFVQLYEMWCRRVMSYALKSLRDTYEAQDVVQETFIQLYKAAPTYRAEGKFSHFLFRIAGNLVRLRYRNSVQVDSLNVVLEDEGGPHPESLSYAPEDGVISSIDIDRLLAELPPRQREALVLVATGAAYAEAANMMEITVDAFAQLVLRGRRTLKNKMKRTSDSI